MKPYEESIEGLAGKFLADGLTPENFTIERAQQICRNTVLPTRNLTVLRLFKSEIIEAMKDLIDYDEDWQGTEESKLENIDITY